MGDDKNIRHRFTVPRSDELVEEWIEAQSNLGFSLRVLIRAFVRSYGVRDATCMELGVPVKKVGRPSKQAKIALGQMLEGEGGPLQEMQGGGQLFPPGDDEEDDGPELPAMVPPARQEPVQPAVPAPREQKRSAIDDMLGVGKSQPSKSQQGLMDGIMGLDT